jgi:hypothetical protein
MKFKNGLVLAAIACLAVWGCATQPPDSSTSTQAPPREVPRIRVIADCGTCVVKPGVPELIVEGYQAAAAGSGAKLMPGQEALVVIKEYAARDDTARFLAGAFAGKDEIKAAVAFQGKTFMVEDYYRNAWLGIDHLAKKIGEMVFERVAQ